MSRPILKGSVDQSTVIRIVDATDGTPETAVTSATAGLGLSYRREGGTVQNLTESDLAALDSVHSDGGMLHIGAGYYRVDLPDAACATGANGVLVFGVVTGMVVVGTYHALTDYNPYDAVRLGLTALPNAAAEAAGGLYTRGSGAGQIAQDANGRVSVNVVALNNDATALLNLHASADVVYRGTVTSAPTTTSWRDTGLTQTATNHWKGRIAIFRTGNQRYEATEILAFTPATDEITCTALSAAPATNDTYVVL